jgi:hypothetical protein
MKKHFQMLTVALVLALFAGLSFADATLQLGTLLDDDDGGLRMVTLAGNERTGLALNFGQTWHDPGIDDGNNEFLGVDWFVKFGMFRFAVGGSYWSEPLHLTSKRLNAHLSAAIVFPVNRWLSVSSGIDHWSNCRRICNHKVDEIRNDPRNALSGAVSLVF